MRDDRGPKPRIAGRNLSGSPAMHNLNGNAQYLRLTSGIKITIIRFL